MGECPEAESAATSTLVAIEVETALRSHLRESEWASYSVAYLEVHEGRLFASLSFNLESGEDPRRIDLLAELTRNIEDGADRAGQLTGEERHWIEEHRRCLADMVSLCDDALNEGISALPKGEE